LNIDGNKKKPPQQQPDGFSFDCLPKNILFP
jgi:hypothetical protein